MNTKLTPDREEGPVPLEVVEDALRPGLSDPGESGVGPWPFLATPGGCRDRPARASRRRHRSPAASTT